MFWNIVTVLNHFCFIVMQAVIVFTSILNSSISKLNILKLAILIWTDCGFLFFFCLFELFTPKFSLIFLKKYFPLILKWIVGEHSSDIYESHIGYNLLLARLTCSLFGAGPAVILGSFLVVVVQVFGGFGLLSWCCWLLSWCYHSPVGGSLAGFDCWLASRGLAVAAVWLFSAAVSWVSSYCPPFFCYFFGCFAALGGWLLHMLRLGTTHMFGCWF